MFLYVSIEVFALHGGRTTEEPGFLEPEFIRIAFCQVLEQPLLEISRTPDVKRSLVTETGELVHTTAFRGFPYDRCSPHFAPFFRDGHDESQFADACIKNYYVTIITNDRIDTKDIIRRVQLLGYEYAGT